MRVVLGRGRVIKWMDDSDECVNMWHVSIVVIQTSEGIQV